MNKRVYYLVVTIGEEWDMGIWNNLKQKQRRGLGNQKAVYLKRSTDYIPHQDADRLAFFISKSRYINLIKSQ
ncbi:MAG: hypothetical protein KAV87_12875 [Desulfobacteraceae bacterium]|nr:hypothetical protein [Desulfobacteraceae bacterium]